MDCLIEEIDCFDVGIDWGDEEEGEWSGRWDQRENGIFAIV
jgi:hypothetical protein